jgi:hexosaminidase
MKRIFPAILFLLSLTLFSCKEQFKPKSLSIIPEPVHARWQPGHFTLNNQSRILLGNHDSLSFEAHYLAGFIRSHSGFDLKIVPLNGIDEIDRDIILRLSPGITDSDEGYQLKVNRHTISILANTPTGIFYGIQSLLQVFPASFYAKAGELKKVDIPQCYVKDAPRFGYRGMHLDVSRHFFPPADVKKYIDMLAMYKFNTFHWHLTDDQGWRIEIKHYPRLTEVGAWRDSTLIGRYGRKPVRYDKKRYGGFYTQDEVRNIVQYAQQRHITIIPEIEMPGHSSAALAAYPELACNKGPFHVATTWGVFRDIYCPKENTFHFIENVLSEVMALFPSKYIHIGGDEVPKARWKSSRFCQQLMKKEGLKDEEALQSWFIRRIEQFLNAHGRKLIGWDEILQGGLSPNATVMSWRGIKGGIAAAQNGHDAIMTPGTHCYFDHYQADRQFQPLAIGGFTTLKKVYSYEPVPEELNAKEAQHILGAQGNVWTEYISDFKQVQYMTLPRMAALAEVVWTPASRKNWHDFQRRIQKHFKIYQALGYNYCPGSYQVSIMVKDTVQTAYRVALESEIYQPDIRYTLDGTRPGKESKKYTGPFEVKKGTRLQAAVFENGKMMEKPVVKEFK